MGTLTFTKMTRPADSTFTCGVQSIDKMVQDSYFFVPNETQLCLRGNS